MSKTDFLIRDPAVRDILARIASSLTGLGQSLSVAESCTAGLVGYVLTSISGSSAWFAGGIIAYSNRIKISLLGVDEETLRNRGAVSRECVLQMADRVAALSGTENSIAVSGIAGPGGGTEEKPVGTVHIAWQTARELDARRFLFAGDREEVRKNAVVEALNGLEKRLKF